VNKSRSADDSRDWRVFCAVELPHNVRERIRQHITTIRSAVPEAHASWSRPENTHLTLKFFGNVQQSRISRISTAADLAVKQAVPFKVLIGGTGTFPGPSRARVLWIGVKDTDRKLVDLQQRFEKECAEEGFEEESRAFRPHLTIARVRRPEGSQTLAQAHLDTKFEDIVVEVKELILFRSEPSSQGSKYTPLSRHALKVL
jgi:2'-5' RNA ligase